MRDPITYKEALNIAQKALERYQRAETKGEVEDIFLQYGRDGIGYRPLCRLFFTKMSLEKALRSYKKRQE